MSKNGRKFKILKRHMHKNRYNNKIWHLNSICIVCLNEALVRVNLTKIVNNFLCYHFINPNSIEKIVANYEK